MRKQSDMELKVGVFVSVGLGLVMIAIIMLGGAQSFFTRHNSYVIHFPSAEGLISGAKVTLGGLNVGTVTSLDFNPKTRTVETRVEIEKKYEEWIRKDSLAEIATQGLLGDKFVTISSGSPEEPIIPDGSAIEFRPAKDLQGFISKGDKLMQSLTSIAASMDRLLKTFEAGNKSETFFQGMSTTAKNLSSATEKLNQQLDQIQLKAAIRNLNGILEKINNGTGTLGALVNDPSLYDDIKSLTGGANRNRIMRNLVRKTIKDSEKAEIEEATQDNQKK